MSPPSSGVTISGTDGTAAGLRVRGGMSSEYSWLPCHVIILFQVFFIFEGKTSSRTSESIRQERVVWVWVSAAMVPVTFLTPLRTPHMGDSRLMSSRETARDTSGDDISRMTDVSILPRCMRERIPSGEASSSHPTYRRMIVSYFKNSIVTPINGSPMCHTRR